MKNTAVLILAAGAAKRMGTLKQLLPYKNTTLLGAVIEEVLRLKNTDVYVVLGAQSSLISKSVASYPVQLLINKDWQLGLGSSLAFGIENIQDYDSVLVVLADQLNVNAEHFQKLLNKSLEANCGIVATAFQDLVSVPAVFSGQYFTELKSLKGDQGAKALFLTHANQLSTVQVSDLFRDIDVPEDYKKLRDEAELN